MIVSLSREGMHSMVRQRMQSMAAFKIVNGRVMSPSAGDTWLQISWTVRMRIWMKTPSLARHDPWRSLKSIRRCLMRYCRWHGAYLYTCHPMLKLACKAKFAPLLVSIRCSDVCHTLEVYFPLALAAITVGCSQRCNNSVYSSLQNACTASRLPLKLCMVCLLHHNL